MMRWILALLCAWPGLSVEAAPYGLDADQSRLGFAYRSMGATVQGEFRALSATLDYDPAHPERSGLSLSANIAGIDAGHPDASVEALRPAFFDAARHPRTRFVSSAVRMDGPSRATVSGTLSLKGRSRRIRFPVTLRAEPGGLRMNGTLTLNRLDYGIGSGEWADPALIENGVRIGFSMRFIPQPVTAPH